jgi:hypothetical protein
MYLQSIKSGKHNAAKSVNRSILKKSRHIGCGVFIVHSSMILIQPVTLTTEGGWAVFRFRVYAGKFYV